MNFNRVKELMDEAVAEHGVPCSEIAITLKGETVYRYRNGFRDDNKEIPLRGDELYFLYSATKPITCTAALQLVEQGKLKLDDPVSAYIPEFDSLSVMTPQGAVRAQNVMTVHNLFTMTSGLNYDLQKPAIQNILQSNPNPSTLDMVRAFSRDPLQFEPGSHFRYGLSHDVLAAIVEVVSGLPFGTYLQKNIFDVCGMKHTGFAINEDVRSKMCSLYTYIPETDEAVLVEKVNGFSLSAAYQSGGAGLISCVDDYSRFVAEMASGNRLLKKETIDLMRANHLNPQAWQDFQACKCGYSYGLGVRTSINSNFPSNSEFGWDGAGGAYVLIDPVQRLGVFYATHIKNHGTYLYQNLHPAIRDAIYEQILS